MRYFYKVYVNPIRDMTKPIISVIGADNWATLCVLAAYMDEHKECYPTLRTIGHLLGVSEQSAGKRIKKLAKEAYDDKPLIEIRKGKLDGQGMERNFYKVVTDTVTIFEKSV